MRLKTINYSQFEGTSNQWGFKGLTLENVNLIVGKNAVGKSRVINVVTGLATMLSSSNKLMVHDGNYEVFFEGEDNSCIIYRIKFVGRKIIKEEFVVDEIPKLERGEGGIGKIYAEKMEETIEFQSPEDEIAAVVRRDAIQHSYFEPLYQWASRLLVYHFGSSLGKETVELMTVAPPTMDLRNEQAVVSNYAHGYNQLGDELDLMIREDMKAIGYELEDVRAGATEVNTIPSPFLTLSVKERDIANYVPQNEISTGMFRALSLFTQLNIAFMTNYTSCVLIDDIGEGLDYDRSSLLIERLIVKSRDANVQLVMSTNDRFVMNKVPLNAWTILQRSGGEVRVFNYETSKKTFDDFEFSGLNNFDFFAYDYLDIEGKSEEESADEVGDLR